MYLGATPDLLVECSCCGSGVVEVKCPWKVKDGQLSDLLSDTNGCVTEVDGELELKKKSSPVLLPSSVANVCV